MINLTGLWTATNRETGEVLKDKNGNPYMTGKLGTAKVMLFKNAHKKDKQPDYNLVLAEFKKPEAQSNELPVAGGITSQDDMPF